MWVEILLEICKHPSIVGSSEHFLCVQKSRLNLVAVPFAEIGYIMMLNVAAFLKQLL